MTVLDFNSSDRMDWIRDITRFRYLCSEGVSEVLLSFDQIELEELSPVHIVTLACLVELFNKKGILVRINRKSKVGEELYSKYQLKEYWIGGKNYADAHDDRLLNLQRINENEKDFYGIRVSDYLKSKYFKSKDMSPVSSSITEAYYNIFDHAEAEGNAFSMLSLDKDRSKLTVAICDFGIGIAHTVKQFLNSDIADEEAIQMALKNNFTIKSSTHNNGQGLGNIISSCTDKDYCWIISNGGALVANGSNIHKLPLAFSFNGTLLFYTMSLSHFDDEELINDFNW